MIANMNEESSVQVFAALSSPVRLRILLWLLDPRLHFPPQVDGDLVEDGVCVGFITEKVGLTQPTVSSHMKKLADAGLVRGKRIGNWMFYKPVRENIAAAGLHLSEAAAQDPE